MLLIAGKSEDKLVIKGVYRLYETSGIPLDFIFDFIHSNGMTISWLDLHEEAQANGMKHKRILSKLEEPITNIWGEEYWEIVKKKLEVYYEKS